MGQKKTKKQGKRIKIEVNRITLKFLMRLELRTRVVLNTESSFVQVPFVFRVEEGVEESDMSCNFSHSLFFVLIYSDELINPSLS